MQLMLQTLAVAYSVNDVDIDIAARIGIDVLVV